MIKNYLLKILAVSLFVFVISCDNTTDDPPNQNKSNSGNSGTITGPRILSKITSGNVTTEEYITDLGILSQAIMRDYGSTNATTATVTYTNNKITKIKYQDNVTPHVMDYEYNVAYSNGKISGLTMVQNNPFASPSTSDFTVTYDPAGTLYRIEEKKKMSGSTDYTHYAEYKFTFSASNLAQVDYTAMLMDNGTPDQATASTITYAYDNYDAKINPYTTLPKEFFIVMGTVTPINFYMISSNNVGKITIHNPMGPAVSVPKAYLYDSQNYPVSDQGQMTNYIYKAL